MSIQAVGGVRSSGDINWNQVDSKVKSQIIGALANVISAYLDTVSKNYAKIAEQDAAERREKREAGRAESIDQAKAKDESRQEKVQKSASPSAQGAPVTSSGYAAKGLSAAAPEDAGAISSNPA